MDFITDLPLSINKVNNKKYNLILVVINRYTKLARYIPCTKDITAEALAELFLRYWFKDQGLPASIISDRGSVFTSKFWSTLCFYLKIKRGLLTAFYP